MKKAIFILMFMAILGIYNRKAEALYIHVVNIGPAPLLALNLNFATTAPNFSGYDFQLFSHRARVDPTNIYFPFVFNESNPILQGESFDTFLIPELTNSSIPSFRLHSSGMSTYNAFSNGNPTGVLVTPDVTSIVLFSSSPAIPVSVQLDFHSGGEPVPNSEPIPEPSTWLLLGIGLVGIVVVSIRKKLSLNKRGVL